MRNFKRWAAIFLSASMLLPNNMMTPKAMAASQQEAEGTELAVLQEDAGAKEAYAKEGELYVANLDNLDEFETFRGAEAGTWSASNGVLRIDGGNGNKAIAKDKDFTDFAYEADVTVKESKDPDQNRREAQGGILFRASRSGHDHPDRYYGYYFCLNVKDQMVVLGRSSGDNWTEIATKKMTIKYGSTYRLKVTAYGNHITCYVDDNGSNYAKIDVIDNEHASGSVGARNWYSETEYSNMKVTSYQETALDENASYTNPLLNMCADPDILYHNGTYFLYPTNAGDANDDQGIKVYTSTDLVHWTEKGFAFRKGDGWGEGNFWAPDLIERDGVFYMYYVANERLCVATSDSPLGPFRQDEYKPMHADTPEIDAHVFYDEASGKYYIYFVRFDNGNVMFGAELNDDMHTIKEETVTRLFQADQGWDQDMGNINEGPFMLTKDGKYYLTYSGAHFQSINYGSAYAVADSPLGPFTKYQNNPIMKSNALAYGTGHHCITESPDGKELFMVYHSHHDLQNTEPRQLCIDRMQFTTDAEGNTVLEVKGPTVTPQAIPSGAVDVNNLIEFDKESLGEITVKAGTAVKDWGLPAQVGLVTSKGDAAAAYKADVTWDTSAYDPEDSEQQVLKVKGTATLPEGVENLGNIPLETELQVTVNENGEAPIRYKVEKLEAEHAALAGLARAVSNGAASGGMKVGYIDDTSSTVTFTLKAPQDGTYRVEVAADGDPAFPSPGHQYWVNGDTANAKQIRYQAAGFDNWILYPIEVELKKGKNTLTFTHSGREASFAELDYINFYTAYPKIKVTLGGKEWDGFDMDQFVYEQDVEDLSAIPEVGASVNDAVKDIFAVTVRQATKERPEALVAVSGSEGSGFEKRYTIRFLGAKTFNNPLVNYGADPFVTYQDGYYYYIRVKKDKSIWVSKAKELSRIGQVEPKMVYTPANGEPHSELWAPEIHFLNGKWYIYYAADYGNNYDHRMYVLESKTADAQGEYTFKGKAAPATDRWAIDQTVLEHNGQLYAIWSGWEGTENVDQRIYIAKMENPWTISGERVELSKPEYNWEKQGGTPTINEGPQVVKAPDGTVNILYSASGSWTDFYCLGRLTLKKDADPMEKSSWMKADQPVFEKNDSSTYSTGHACFTTSPDGKEDYIVYHATKNSGDGWNGRGVRTQRIYWNEDGTPDIGAALEYNARVNWPSGMQALEYLRLEAEDGVRQGNASVVETYNSSGGKKVSRLRAEGDQVVFSVNAKEAGNYKLYLGAAAGVENAGLSVKVNDAEAMDKAVVNFNASYTDRIVTDNWAGYEVEATLKQGENTITVGKSENLGTADLDYIEFDPCVKDGHQWEASVTIKEASCEEGGVAERQCGVCGIKEEMEVPALGHTGGSATCSKKAVCDRCKKEYGSIDSSKHGERETKDVKEPTCTEAGYTGDTYCKDCGAKLESGKEITPLGHTGGSATCSKKAICERCQKEYGEIDSSHHGETEIKDEKAAACTEAGYTGDTYCKDCGAKLKSGKEIAALGHKWDAGKVTKAATATKNGVMTYTCTVCKTTRTEAIPATGVPAVGTKLKVSSGSYQVTKNQTVMFTRAGKASKTVTIPATIKANGVTYKVTAIAANAFKGNKTVTKVTMGGNIKTIGKNAFYGCTKLKTVTIGKNVTVIGDGAFCKCTALTKVTIPSKVSRIGKKAFYGCKKLKSVTIGKNVTAIGDGAFYKCTALTKVTIPSKVSKIGKKAFYQCKKLKSISIKTKKLASKNVGSKAFQGIYAKAAIKVPKSKLKAYKKLLKARGVSSKAKILFK